MAGLQSLSEIKKMLFQAGLQAECFGADVHIFGLSNNSKEVRKSDLFICKGFGFKPEYLKMAEEKGAVAYLGEHPVSSVTLPFLQVSDVRKAQSLVAKAFYENPSDAFTLVGITGTKGKTTTAYDLKTLLDACTGKETGLLSTIERFVGDEHEPSHLTTPESLDLQQLFVRAKENGLPCVTMEVSSQAYKMERVYGQKFDFGLFLNFGADHICEREHPDLEDYFACKLQLMRACKTAIICRATDRFEQIYTTAKSCAEKVLVIGSEGDCDYLLCDVVKEAIGFSFTVCQKGFEKSCRYFLPQEGRFNLENALAAITVGHEMGFPHEQMAEALKHVAVPGRMNLLQGGGVRVLVDYAHNKLSFQSLFDSLKKDYPDADLIVVAGAPGERDHARRTDIGELCGKYAKRVIFTSDDPGFDDPQEICLQMAKAAEGGGAEIEICIDRTAAVEKAVGMAKAGDVVILAGKGHEVTQRVRGEYVYYESDAAIAKRMLIERA